MTEISDIIFAFRSFLSGCWSNIPSIQDLDYTDTFEENYVETLWELILETLLIGKLEGPVGPITIRCYYDNQGIELYPTSNRAFFPECKVTHEVICLPKNGQYVFDFIEQTNIFLTENARFNLKHFVTFSANQNIPYFQAPPFDYLVCSVNQTTRVFKVEDCNFYVRKVSDEV